MPEHKRENWQKGGVPLTDRVCRICKVNYLGITNQSGVCRQCQRAPGQVHAKDPASRAKSRQSRRLVDNQGAPVKPSAD